MSDSDMQLIQALKKRELTAYRQLFYDYHPRLILFANKFTNDMEAARDIVQDAFLSLWEKSAYLTIKTSPSAYLFKIVRNQSLNYQRHLKVKQSADEELAQSISAYEHSVYVDINDPFQSLMETELESKIAHALNDLPEKCRSVFVMSRNEHLRNKEIADKMGISVKMVEKYITKAIRVLRVELTDYVALLGLLILHFFQK